MKAIGHIIGVCIIILLLGAVLAAINQFRGGEYIDYHNVASGVETTTITLSQELLDDETGYITISSNVSADAPLPGTYTSTTRELQVTGLDSSYARRLTIEYLYPQLASFWGVDLLSRSWLTFIGLGIIGIIVAAVVVATRKE